MISLACLGKSLQVNSCGFRFAGQVFSSFGAGPPLSARDAFFDASGHYAKTLGTWTIKLMTPSSNSVKMTPWYLVTIRMAVVRPMPSWDCFVVKPGLKQFRNTSSV